MTIPLFRIALVGSRGAGKTNLLLSLYASMFDLIQPTADTTTHATRVSSPWLSPAVTRYLKRIQRHHLLPPRSRVPAAAGEQADAVDVSERLTFVWHRAADGDVLVEIVALAAEEMYVGQKLDGRALRNRLTADGYDLVVVVSNPFTLDARIAEQALSDLATKGLALGYTLADALRLACRLLFHYGPKRINRAGIGFDELPAEVANYARADVRKGRLSSLLARDGVPPQQAEELMRIVRLLAETVACDTADYSLQRDLVSGFPNSMVALTRMDLATMTPSLHPSDLTALAERILPPHRERLASDVTAVESLDLEVQFHKTRPVFVRDLATAGGAALWNAIRARYKPGAGPAVAVAKPASVWRRRVVGVARKTAQSRVLACTAAALFAAGTSLGVVAGFARAWPWVFTALGAVAATLAFVLGRREQASAAAGAASSEAAAMSEPQAVRKTAPKPQEVEEIVEASTTPKNRLKPSRNGHAAPCEAY